MIFSFTMHISYVLQKRIVLDLNCQLGDIQTEAFEYNNTSLQPVYDNSDF